MLKPNIQLNTQISDYSPKLIWIAERFMQWHIVEQEVMFTENFIHVKTANVFLDRNYKMQYALEHWNPFQSTNLNQVMELLMSADGYNISSVGKSVIVTITVDGITSEYKQSTLGNLNDTVCELILDLTGFYNQ